MQLIRGLHNLRPEHRGCVITIGNFDGVHLGHQEVLAQVADKAAELCLPSVLMTFEPYPSEFFQTGEIPPRLTRFREKMEALRRFSIERILSLRFDQKLSALKAEDFIRQILVDQLGARYVVIGDDFRFGKGRKGDFAMLKAAGEAHNFDVASMRTFEIMGDRVSSTRIRHALQSDELEFADQLLGRPYRMSGRVAHGDKRGRTIGYPTANIHLHRQASPLNGVYAVEMLGIRGEPVPGVANIGVRPTVSGSRAQLEVHLFDFNDDIYGRHVQVEFRKKLRDEQRYESFVDMKAQIDADAQQ
ncbi:MAG: bifunctional riboflavin kinase/FAD synthetase, partial [Gammaproteobacteria bacterium]|nr:bifunctional riboflavin kinase/FAD synthetase [Gammaproteobacteria bacterium]